jgi:hypothetical protein
MTVYFAPGHETELARYVAQLVREGVTFAIQNDVYGYEVKLLGGY